MANSRSGVGIELAKTKFFDREIATATDRAKLKALSKFGSYVRSDAKKSMKSSRGRLKVIRSGPRKGKNTRVFKPSPAGTPPRSIEGTLKRFLFFVYEKEQSNVIIGPVLLPNKSHRGDPIPGLHEHGGMQLVRFGTARKMVVANYRPRPYMKPAGEKNLRKLGDLFRDAIK